MALKTWQTVSMAAAAGAAAMALLWGGSHLGGSAPAPAPPAPASPPVAAAPAPEPVVPMQPQCLPGYIFYPDRGTCSKVYEKPVESVKNAGCKPGEKQDVPDPNRPGYVLHQVCGYSGGG